MRITKLKNRLQRVDGEKAVRIELERGVIFELLDLLENIKTFGVRKRPIAILLRQKLVNRISDYSAE